MAKFITNEGIVYTDHLIGREIKCLIDSWTHKVLLFEQEYNESPEADGANRSILENRIEKLQVNREMTGSIFLEGHNGTSLIKGTLTITLGEVNGLRVFLSSTDKGKEPDNYINKLLISERNRELKILADVAFDYFTESYIRGDTLISDIAGLTTVDETMRTAGDRFSKFNGNSLEFDVSTIVSVSKSIYDQQAINERLFQKESKSNNLSVPERKYIDLCINRELDKRREVREVLHNLFTRDVIQLFDFNERRVYMLFSTTSDDMTYSRLRLYIQTLELFKSNRIYPILNLRANLKDGPIISINGCVDAEELYSIEMVSGSIDIKEILTNVISLITTIGAGTRCVE